ncbi:uncharacterized protein [Magallana gigas]|uniref:uncharacterized protein isoform X3 n=1 Tax=Magallana gigas TaxID=29159 RepID=UPI003342CD18
MAASGFSLEAVKNFMIENDCKVTNHELVTHFKSYLNDPIEKSQKLNREKFKEFVNTLAGIKTDERGEKILVLKKKFKPGHNNADSFSQLEAARDSRVQDESRVRAQTESSSTHGADQSAEMNSNHLSNASSISSVASTTKDRDGDPDEDSQSSGSCFNLDSEEKEWIVASSSSDYHPMHKMLTKNPNLVNIKDFTSGVSIFYISI